MISWAGCQGRGAGKKKGNLGVQRMKREQARIFSILDMAGFVSAWLGEVGAFVFDVE